MKTTDGELLRRYARERSETAFEELVGRRISLVFSAALRQVNNDAHLAEDVTQAVFTDLARKAAKLSHHTSLAGWLYTTTRFIAANIRRTEQRRAAREKEAHAMNAIHSTSDSEPDWTQIRPLLDDVMHALDGQDCQALLMRHFERCSYAEIASRFGLTEDAARMRVNRAVEKLRDALAKRGVTSTALTLAGLLANNAVGAAPAHLAARTARMAMSGAAGANGLSVLLTSRFKLAFAAVVIMAAVTMVIISRRIGTESFRNVVDTAGSTNASEEAVLPANPPAASGSNARLMTDAVLHLQIVTADTGKPIPDVPIDYFGWGVDGLIQQIKQQKLKSDRLGFCDVPYPRNITRLELITGKGPFADTRLLLRPTLGDVIPTNYVLRVERAVPIGGTVVDADGNPVSGATVAWNLNALDPDQAKSQRSNEYYGTTYEATTGQDGRWQVNRMASAVIPCLIGEAKESNNVDSGSISTALDAMAERQLRDGTFVFKLGRAVTAEGSIVDVNGAPLSGATIVLGNRFGVSRRDGTFSVNGCVPGRQQIMASASGFPSTGMEVDLGDTPKPIRLVLPPGKSISLRIMGNDGNPISHAFVASFVFSVDHGELTPQGQWTDDQGRVAWTNAPDTEIEFTVSGDVGTVTQEKIRPDGQEHVITVSPISALYSR